ncbi:hypothetical protein BDV93DRAFT_523432 [Ceratobasidium sp. AG-I]|nr:hypothetical protein BDV93DRAFT_523432 [Ceratobasidium sp. AG-I]
MASSKPHQRRWVYFDDRTRSQPLDALNQWKDLARASVEWDLIQTRGSDNSVTHIAIPILTCQMYHPPCETDELIFRQVGRRREDAQQYTRERVEDWLRQRHQNLVELYCEYHDNGVESDRARFSTHRISFVFNLNHMPIVECQGAGRTVKAAKNDAARCLIAGGYLMLFAQFYSPRRVC